MPILATHTPYVAPPPAVTQIYPLSHAYWRLSAWNRVIKPRLAPLSAVLGIVALELKGLLRRATHHLGQSLKRTTRNGASAIRRALRDLLRAAVRPALALTAMAIFWVATPGVRIVLKGTDPAPAAGLPVAKPPTVQPVKPARKPPAKRAPDRSPKPTLARFHGNAQTFANDTAAREALADALNIPPHVVASDLTRALELAATNSRAMQGYVGHFPLPPNTSPRLLAVLTPADVQHLARLLTHTTTIDKPQFTLTASLASGDLHLDTKVRTLPQQSGTGQCFRYAMTFIRRTFRHSLTTTACRTGTTWSFQTPPANRSTP